jgi:DNA polymerase III subunit epsilon
MDLLARRDAARMARNLRISDPLYIDTETTGTGPHAEVIEIALIDSQGAPVFESLVRPRGQIEQDAFQVHGISEAMVCDAPTWAEVWSSVESLLKDRLVGAYNSDFDLRILQQTHQRYWVNWHAAEGQFFCIMKLYARFAGNWDPRRRSYRWQSLDVAGQQCGIPLPNAHRARDDALLARAVFEYMVNWVE